MSHSKLLFMLLVGLMLSGCQTVGGSKDVTGGVSLEFSMRDGDTEQAVLYRFERRGTLSHGGGIDARRGVTSWTGSLSPQDIDRLVSHLRENGWFDETPQGSGQPAARRYTVRVRDANGRHTYDLRGTGPEIEALQSLLSDLVISNRDRLLFDALPRPDAPPGADAGSDDGS